jgi:hypothetical protein
MSNKNVTCIFSFGYFPGVRLSFPDVSELKRKYTRFRSRRKFEIKKNISTRISLSIRTKLRKAFSPCSGDEKCILCLVRGPEEETALQIPKRRLDDNIKNDQQEVGWGCG